MCLSAASSVALCFILNKTLPNNTGTKYEPPHSSAVIATEGASCK